MLKLKFAAAMALVWLGAGALEVSNTAGSLSTLVSDPAATSLTITGTMDARDFSYIANNMSQLQTLDLSGVEIVGYTSDEQLFGTENTFEANSIPSLAFFDSALSSVTLPDNLASIGNYAFAGCENLTQVSLPSGLSQIGNYAFSGTGLTSVDVPSLAAMGEGSFSNCENLTTARIDCYQVGYQAFAGDSRLSNVTLGMEVGEISDGAFKSCTSLTGLTIEGDAITHIGDEAFMASGLESVNWADMNRLSSIGNWAFANTPLLSADLPNSVESLGEGAFFYDTRLSSFNRPTEVTQIPAYSLAGLPNLNLSKDDIDLSNVTEIGDYAFYNSTARSYRVIFPSTLEHIGKRAFAGTTHIENYSSEATTVPSLGANVWEGIDQPSIELAIDDAEVADAYKSADQWKEFNIISYPTAVERLSGEGVNVWAGHGIITIETAEGAAAQVVAVNGTGRTFTVKAGRTDLTVAPGIYLVRVGERSFKVLVR